MKHSNLVEGDLSSKKTKSLYNIAQKASESLKISSLGYCGFVSTYVV